MVNACPPDSLIHDTGSLSVYRPTNLYHRIGHSIICMLPYFFTALQSATTSTGYRDFSYGVELRYYCDNANIANKSQTLATVNVGVTHEPGIQIIIQLRQLSLVFILTA